jgi:tripartite-type tricarboxylate transporter receptor subunit TctC
VQPDTAERTRVSRCAAALAVFGCAAVLCVSSQPAGGQGYPVKPIRLIVPFTPAGATDVLARIVGEGLSKRLGQKIIVDNRPGAGGNIGAQLTAQAAPDGYTLIMGPSSVYAIAMTLYASPGYDLVRDLAPVSTVANVPHVLVVPPSLNVKSVKELIAAAQARPDALNAASQGTGTVSHLEAEMFQSMAGVRFTHVPYKGSTPAQMDLLAGRVDLMFDSIAATLPQVRAGKLRPLAVCSEHRSAAYPGVPTMAESGLAGYKAESWLGILVPARTPRSIVDLLNRELVALLADPETRATLSERGFEPLSSTPEQFAARIRSELAEWAKVVKASGARVE